MLDHISAIVPVAKERRRIDLADSENEERGVVTRFVSTDQLADFPHFLAAVDFRGGLTDFEIDPQGLRVSWEDWAKRIEETPSLQDMPEPSPADAKAKSEDADEDEDEEEADDED